MALKNYREMYISTIVKNSDNNVSRETLSKYSFDQLKKIAYSLENDSEKKISWNYTNKSNE